jgi:hypothetical protein
VIGSGRATGTGLVELKLQNDWAFERRTFDGQALSHLYVAHANPLPVLLAEARNGGAPLLTKLPAPPPPLAPEPRPVTVTTVRRGSSRTRQVPVQAATADTKATPTSSSSSRLARLESLRLGGPRAASQAEGESSGVIALQVVPYRP